jgi:hypothetical protein
MNNEPQEHHVMVLETTHPSGVEEWYCPTCGRRILMQWPPNYKKITLEAGDEYAIHSGGKGGVSMGAKIVQSPETDSSLPAEFPDPEAQEDCILLEDEKLLEPWRKWMDQVDFDNLWQNGPAK